ncbi:MAG: HTH_XRE protein [Podoviridae sp. ctcf755]|nr:MAG: HTH_XRE protein [Podoviridae sp. ctcf755]
MLSNREINRITYLINEILADFSSGVPLNSKIVIIYDKNGNIEDYDMLDDVNDDGMDNILFDEEDIHLPFIAYEDEEYEETDRKTALIYFLSCIHPDLPYNACVLKAIRLIFDLSQQDMANRLEIARQFYNQMENGSRPVSKNVIEKIAMLDNFSENDFKKKGE